jgi:hypothetical protein
VTTPETHAPQIAKLTACLEALGTQVRVPDGLTARQRVAYLVGALSAADDAFIEQGNLLEEDADHLDRFAEGYAAAVEQLECSVVNGMVIRLHGYRDILRLPGFNYVRRPLKSAAYNAITAASQILTSFGGQLEEVDGVLGLARGHLIYAGEDVERVRAPIKRPEPTAEEIAEWINREAAQHLEQIEEHGFYTQYVGEDPDSGAPPYAYTVGLSSQDAYGYEFAISGLSPETSHGILWNLVRAFEPDAMTPADALEVPEIVASGYNVRLRTASTAAEFGMIEQLLGERSTVWQAVCPDGDGRFPGEAGYALEHDRQHLL